MTRKTIWVGHVASMGQKINIKFWKEIIQEREHLNDLDIDSRVTIKFILKEYDLNWVHLAQERDHCGLLDIVMNFRASSNCSNFLLAEHL
jgi:hypothetical protein